MSHAKDAESSGLQGALSLSWGGHFQEAYTILHRLPADELVGVQEKYQYMRCCAELGVACNITSTSNDAYDRLIQAIRMRRSGALRESLEQILEAYDQIFVPDADRELLEAMYQMQLARSSLKLEVARAEKLVDLGKIVQFWDSDDVPDDVEFIVRRWRRAGMRYELFSERTASLYISTHFGPFYVDMFYRCHHPAMKADLFRLIYLVNEGGIYVDADEDLLGSFEDYIDSLELGSFHLLCPYALERVANNNVLIASRFHPVLLKCLEQAIANIAYNVDYPIWRSTGPAILGMSIAWYVRHFGIDYAINTIRLDRTMWNGYIGKNENLVYKSDQRNWQSTM